MAISNNERAPDQLSTIRSAIGAALAGLQTAMPCIVESYDQENVTVTVQPCIQALITQEDGSIKLEDFPLLQDVPVMFQRSGGVTMTFPINVGDECYVVFSSRCIDTWWQSGGVQPPFENRKHDLSDGFAFFGPQSQPNKISNISTDSVQLRTDDGQAFIELNPSNYAVEIKTSGNVTVDAAMSTFKGIVKFENAVEMDSGLSVTGDLKNNDVNVGSSHGHSNVQPGTSNSGGPVSL